MVGKLTDSRGVSASRLPALFGVDRCTSQNELMRQLIDARAGKENDFSAGEAAHWGNLLEPVIAREALVKLGMSGKVDVADAAVLEDDDIDFASSLDAVGFGGVTIKHDPANGVFCIGADEIECSGNGPIEIKNTSAAPEDVPPIWRGTLQLQGQIMCMGASWGAVAVLYARGGAQMRVFVFKADPVVHAKIKAAILDLEARIESDRPYDLADAADAVAAHPTSDDREPPIALDPELIPLVTEIQDAKAAIKAANKIIETHSTTLMQVIGNASSATGATDDVEYTVKWPTRHYRAKPAGTTDAKPERWERSKTLTIIEHDI